MDSGYLDPFSIEVQACYHDSFCKFLLLLLIVKNINIMSFLGWKILAKVNLSLRLLGNFDEY